MKSAEYKILSTILRRDIIYDYYKMPYIKMFLLNTYYKHHKSAYNTLLETVILKDSITILQHCYTYSGEHLRLRSHEDVFASKCNLFYVFTLPFYKKTVKMQTGNA